MRRGMVAVAGALGLALLLAGCGASSAPVTLDETFDADRVVIRDFIGTLTVETIDAGGNVGLHADLNRAQEDLLPIRQSDGTLMIEWLGEPDRERRWWEFWRGRWMADLDRLDDYPSLVLQLPADVALDVTSIIGRWTIDDRTALVRFDAERGEGSIGATQVIELSISGDADIVIGPVAGLLDVSIAGSGTVRGGASSDADISIAGSGDVSLEDVAGQATINIAGSGDATIGDVASAEVRISGSGNVTLGAVASALDARVLGSGDVTVGSVNGAFDASIAGSGDIEVGAGRGDPFDVDIAGSGNVRFGGVGVNPDVSLSGSGSLFLDRLEGELDARTGGSGRVEVGSQ